ATSPTDPSDVEWTEAEQLKIILRRSRHETHISQQGGSSIDGGTGSIPGVPDSEEEETTKKEEESFDPIPRTPEESEDDGNGEEDQGLRISEEERMHEEDESSSTSSFVTNLLNPIIDPGMESIFTTGSSTVTPIPSPQSTMTPSIMTTTTTASQLPIPPTPIPSLDLQNLPTFASVFRFVDRVKSLEVNFSNIPDEQWNLYKALVKAYDADKTILDTYGESAILKRRREEDDDQEGPSAGSDQGSKSVGRSTTGTQSRQLSAIESTFVEEPVQTTCQMEEPSHLVFETGA
nr:hypothetical protein [Tanacetum cinerariifolium]